MRSLLESLRGLLDGRQDDGPDPNPERLHDHDQTTARLEQRTEKTFVDVADAGADTTGATPINDVLQAEIADDTILYFEPGRYLLEPGFVDDHADVEWRAPEGAALVPTNQTAPTPLVEFTGTDTVVSGFEYHVGDCDVAPHIRFVGRDLTVEDFTQVGPADMAPSYTAVDGENSVPLLTFRAPGGVTTARDIDLTFGVAGVCDARRGIFVHGGDGVLHFDDLRMSQWAENTLYGTYANDTDPDSELVIENSVFRNTNVGVRVTGDTTITNCTFVLDGDFPAQGWSDGKRMRGIFGEGGKSTHPDGTLTIRDCDFHWAADVDDISGQPIVIAAPQRSINVVDSNFTNRGNRWPCFELDPHDAEPPDITFENVSFDHQNPAQPAIVIEGEYDRLEASNVHTNARELTNLQNADGQRLQDAVVSKDPRPVEDP